MGTRCSKGPLRTATQEPLGRTDGSQRTYTSITLSVTTLPGCMKAIKQGSCYSSNHCRKLGQYKRVLLYFQSTSPSHAPLWNQLYTSQLWTCYSPRESLSSHLQ